MVVTMEEHAVHQMCVHVLQDGAVAIVKKVGKIYASGLWGSQYVYNFPLCHTFFLHAGMHGAKSFNCSELYISEITHYVFFWLL